jgi:molybdopterin-guanine dinucleotide biosynthesis protein A
MSIAGIILAGGSSSRMGTDKGFLRIGEKNLVEIAMENLAAVCETVRISSNSMDYTIYGLEVVQDVYPGIGPMGGIFSLLKKTTSEWNLVLSVDLPFVNQGLLRFLIQQAEGFQVAVPWSGSSHYEPLCACYHSSVLEAMEKSIVGGNYKLPDLFSELKVKRLTINEQQVFFHPGLFLNVNTPSDLLSAQNMINSIK